MAGRDCTFLAFFLAWSKVQGWDVPLLHVRICHWLDSCKDHERVLMVFRGAANRYSLLVPDRQLEPHAVRPSCRDRRRKGPP